MDTGEAGDTGEAADTGKAARVLIVEDEPMIAFTLEDILIFAGFEIAGVATKLERAMTVIESGVCDAAILDANLGGVSSSPAASSPISDLRHRRSCPVGKFPCRH